MQVLFNELLGHVSSEASIEDEAGNVSTVFDGHQEAEAPNHLFVIKWQVFHVEDAMGEQLQVFYVCTGIARLWVECLFVKYIVELNVDLIINRVNIGGHFLMHLV